MRAEGEGFRVWNFYCVKIAHRSIFFLISFFMKSFTIEKPTGLRPSFATAL